MSTLRELLRLSFPMVVSHGAFAVMIFTDRWFMAQIDATHITAALGGGVAAYFTFSLFMGIITYANALVAQYFGTGEYAKCPRVVTQGVIMALSSLPLLALGACLVGHLFEKMGHHPDQVELERVYFFILMSGSIFTLVKACIASYFSGIGRTRVVMISDVLGVLLNIPLTWMLVFGKFGLPELGIAGAALSTVIASVFTIGLFLSFYFARDHREQFQVLKSFHFDARILRRYLRLGTPSGFESFMNTATFNLFLLMFQSYGIVQGASIAIVFNWDMLSFIPMIGLNIGVMSLIGRFVGARDMARANQVISSGFIMALGYSGLLAILFLIFRVQLVEVFASPGEDFTQIRNLASQMMIGLTTYMMADAIIIIAGGALRGAGDTRWLMTTSISLHVLMLIAQYFIIMVFDYGPIASWWTFVAMIISLAVIYLWRLLGGVWRHPDRLARVMVE
ncbi:MATE family efflux transporter [Pseudomonadota bacterium]